MIGQVQKAPVRYFPALTGLRAVAAWLVFWHHYNPFPKVTVWHQVVHQGYMGVSLFFVLSGFLIYYRYASSRPFSLRDWQTYLLHRFARLMPLYWVLLLLTYLGWAVTEKPLPDWFTVSLDLTLFKGLSATHKFSGIAQSWSLTVEWCFYVLAPLLFMALRRMGAIGLTLGLWAIGALLWQNLPFMAFYTFFGRAFEFVIGMWLASRCLAQRLPTLKYSLLTAGSLILVCVTAQVFCQLNLTDTTAMLWVEIGLYNIILPMGIGLVFVSILQRRSLFTTLLSTRPMQALGRSSYAFYLIHIGIIARAQDYLIQPPVWLKFALLLLIAHGLYRFIEKPLQQCLLKVFDRV